MNTTARSHSLTLILAALTLAATPVFAGQSAAATDRPAQVTATVAPAFPYLLRRAGAAAEVTVVFTVNAQGKVTQASVGDSSNYEFNALTLDAIKQWTFTPATKNGQAVETKLQQTFTFNVGDKGKASGTPTLVADKSTR